jgi:hypothetical protein
VNEVDLSWSEVQGDESGRDARMKDIIAAFPGYENIFKRFESASKMRPWINEYKNNLIEKIKKDV